MIISIFVYEINSRKKVFRSTNPISVLKMNYYMTEFINLNLSGDGVLERDTYNYVYSSSGSQMFVIQVSKCHSIKAAIDTIKHVDRNSGEDLFDVLVTIDNVLYDGEAIKLEMQAIKLMDSQEEKIYKLMMENKKQEMMQKENNYKVTMQSMHETYEEKAKPKVEVKVKRVEKSEKPVLVSIKEKIKLVLDKNGEVVENTLSGEINLVITSADYRQLKIKMSGLSSGIKYSPYLEKGALKKSILKFEKDRGLNKSIPLMKWTGKLKDIPIKYEFWNDEDGDKSVYIMEVTAIKSINFMEINFDIEDLTEVEVDQEAEIDDGHIIWNLGKLLKGESKTIEIRSGYKIDDGIFPISISFVGDEVDSKIDVEKIFVEDDKEIHDYEVRKTLEVDQFTILHE